MEYAQQDLLAFWGKSGRPGDAHGYHPACYHMLDVAACAEAILAVERERLSRLARRLGVEAAVLERILVFLVALHDLGKLSLSFQAKVPELWPIQVLGPLNRPPDLPHGVISLYFLTDAGAAGLLSEMFPKWRPSMLKLLLRATAGHHGEPVDLPENAAWCLYVGRAGEAAAAAVGAFRDIIAPEPLQKLPDREVAVLSWALAGLCVLSDWLGSNRQWFPVSPPELDLAAYWETRARPRAARAIAEAGIGPCRVAVGAGLKHLFPDLPVPSPIQSFAEGCDLGDGPCLAIIEDATGSGKTEAALVLAHRLMRSQSLSGLFFALPTMATANAMYGRLADAYRRLFAADAGPSLVLAHGRRDLHPGFAAVAMRAGAADRRDREDTAEQACAAWLVDDRRKAFLAQVGAGTIDQALLGILPSRHQSLRLWGLADRVLIVDEAHAYDPYMSLLLEALLEFQAALGGSAVVLSATLPGTTRQGLVRAFRCGLGLREAWTPAHRSYPLATLVTSDGVAERPSALRPGLERNVAVDTRATVEAGIEQALDAASAGGAVAVIRNTVDEAIATARDLASRTALPVILFHARFAMHDRLAIEDSVLRRFGKIGDAALPRNAILVATQVVEQSLDLDFDLVVTDLAPIDLLIQRAGRLWRHMDRRPSDRRPVAGPRLVVVAPPAMDDATGQWLDGVLPRTPSVYRNARVLWRTARILQETGTICVEASGEDDPPVASVRSLVETVYGEESHLQAPAGVEKASLNSDGKDSADRSFARQNALVVREGYVIGKGWAPDIVVATRLTEETTTLRLAVERDGIVVPWAHGTGGSTPDHRAWALSEVSVSRRRATGEAVPEGLVSAFTDAKSAWPTYEQEMPILLLQEMEQGEWQGRVAWKDATIEVAYDRRHGLMLPKV